MELLLLSKKTPPKIQMVESKIILHPMSKDDLKHIVEIQNKAYIPFFHEALSIFEEKLRFFPAGCWLASYNGVFAGYLLSHPWLDNLPVCLNSPLGILPDRFNCLYIHDVAVARDYHHKGIGKTLFLKAKEIATRLNYKRMTAISVQDSNPFWSHHSFKSVENISREIKDKLLSYGQDSLYMVLDWEEG